MKRDPSNFRKRFKRWLNGENYWDVRSDELPEYGVGKKDIELFAQMLGPSIYSGLQQRNVSNIDAAYDNIMRQLAWESTYGTSDVAKRNNNFGGVGWNGREYYSYENPNLFVNDYLDMMVRKYGNALNARTPAEYAHELKRKGYYEAPEADYARGLSGMVSISNAARKYMGLPTSSQFLIKTKDNRIHKFRFDPYTGDTILDNGTRGTQRLPEVVVTENAPEEKTIDYLKRSATNTNLWNNILSLYNTIPAFGERGREITEDDLLNNLIAGLGFDSPYPYAYQLFVPFPMFAKYNKGKLRRM